MDFWPVRIYIYAALAPNAPLSESDKLQNMPIGMRVVF